MPGKRSSGGSKVVESRKAKTPAKQLKKRQFGALSASQSALNKALEKSALTLPAGLMFKAHAVGSSKLLSSMLAAAPTGDIAEDVKRRVITVVANRGGLTPTRVETAVANERDQWLNVNMTPARVKGLAGSLTKISSGIYGKAAVTRDELEETETVRACIKLVQDKVAV